MSNEDANRKCIGVKVSVFFAKDSKVKVKVDRNRNSKVLKSKKLLKYRNKVFLLRYCTTLQRRRHNHKHKG